MRDFFPAYTTTWGDWTATTQWDREFAQKAILSGKKAVRDFNVMVIDPDSPKLVLVLSYGLLASPKDYDTLLCGCSIIMPFDKAREIISKMKR